MKTFYEQFSNFKFPFEENFGIFSSVESRSDWVESLHELLAKVY